MPIRYNFKSKLKVVPISVFLLFVVFGTYAQNLTLNGKVADAANIALVGATVQVKGGQSSAITNASGEFNLKTTTPFPLTLLVSYVGFETQEMKVNSANFLAVVLKENSKDRKSVV